MNDVTILNQQLFRSFEGTANGRTISGFYKEVNGEKVISTWWIKN